MTKLRVRRQDDHLDYALMWASSFVDEGKLGIIGPRISDSLLPWHYTTLITTGRMPIIRGGCRQPQSIGWWIDRCTDGSWRLQVMRYRHLHYAPIMGRLRYRKELRARRRCIEACSYWAQLMGAENLPSVPWRPVLTRSDRELIEANRFRSSMVNSDGGKVNE